MSIKGTVPHLVRTSALSRRRLRGSGAASRSVSLIGPFLPPLGDLQPGQLRHPGVQRRQLGVHLVAELVDERGRVQRLAQRGVMRGAVGLEVVRQVLVGVAPPVGANDPDLLAPQAIP